MPLLLALSASAWLVPNHYPPWTSAWNDALAIFALLTMVLVVFSRSAAKGKASWQLAVFYGIGVSVLLTQVATGKIHFFGDGLVASLYLSLWFASILVGRSLAESSMVGEGVSPLAAAWLGAAVLSAGIALAQWSGASNLSLYVVDFPPWGRPFANVAQPNNFCTLCFLGLCGLLWLHQHGRVRAGACYLGAGFLLTGMVASQSRTGWLQIAALVVWGIAQKRRSGLRISVGHLLALGAGFFLLSALWPTLCDLLLLSPGRTSTDQMQAGIRLPFWRDMVDAIGLEPLWGYGWQQVSAAQLRVGASSSVSSGLFEHSHNLILDLVLWNGLPAGVVLIAMLVWWFAVHIRACNSAKVSWLLAAIGGVVIHSMLEFPMEYAYFLIPVGLAMGAVEGFSPVSGRSVRIPRWTVFCAACLLSGLFLWVGAEYLEAEENYRVLRTESAHIGVAGIETPAPTLHLLTQLEAFLRFARTEARPKMTPSELEWMRKVSERYGYPPVLFRYALAAGLNHQPEAARLSLNRICHIHPPVNCDEARQGWNDLRHKYPELAPIEALAAIQPLTK